VRDSLNTVLKGAGFIFPALVPFTTVGKVAVDGVNRLLKKPIEIQGETKTIEFALYPVEDDKRVIPGEAPLQTGAYVLFFEQTDFTTLKMERDGTIKSVSSPYIVINVKPGITLAPEKLQTQ
jgi:hypothetical protein